ncbi:hypothetical protein T07_69 [Trichinella nelsoni]|uniref:Uncharacterized protein n=1 Tax=Trichinella nelsoni TaxID=6336 RepID=A0A0V0S9W3_9BILA|nr:hypothetical protein T07_69 [Trichinella nelsoni]
MILIASYNCCWKMEMSAQVEEEYDADDLPAEQGHACTSPIQSRVGVSWNCINFDCAVWDVFTEKGPKRKDEYQRMSGTSSPLAKVVEKAHAQLISAIQFGTTFLQDVDAGRRRPGEIVLNSDDDDDDDPGRIVFF